MVFQLKTRDFDLLASSKLNNTQYYVTISLFWPLIDLKIGVACLINIQSRVSYGANTAEKS